MTFTMCPSIAQSISEIIFPHLSDVPTRIFSRFHLHSLGQLHNQLCRGRAGELPGNTLGNSAHKKLEERKTILQTRLEGALAE
jgi:hypothetical protein